MCKIGFIIKGYSGKSQYHNANVKPFVDLSYGLTVLGYEVSLFIDESEKHLDEKIKNIPGNELNIIYTQPSNLENIINKSSIKYLILEDDIEIMKNALKYKLNGIKRCVFVQYLYGVNTNKRNKRNSSLALKIRSYLSWELITKKGSLQLSGGNL